MISAKFQGVEFAGVQVGVLLQPEGVPLRHVGQDLAGQELHGLVRLAELLVVELFGDFLKKIKWVGEPLKNVRASYL